MVLEKLFDNLALQVDAFATCRLADGWRLLLPCRDWVTLHYTLQGEGSLRLPSGEIRPLTTNSLAVMPPGMVHAVQCGSVNNEAGAEGQGDPNAPICELVAGPLDAVKLSIACGRVQVSYAGSIGLFDHLKEAIILDFSDSPRMRSNFEALMDEYKRAGPASAAMMTAVMNETLIQVLRRASEQAQGSLPWLSALQDPRLSNVIDTIMSQPGQPHTVESLAEVANMSRATFARHFEQCFGRTPMDYVRDARLRRAAQLLQVSGTSIDGVASKVGYSSRSHFSRAFQSHYGVSPADFRKQHQ